MAKLLIFFVILVRDQEVGGSNPLAPTNIFYSLARKTRLVAAIDSDPGPTSGRILIPLSRRLAANGPDQSGIGGGCDDTGSMSVGQKRKHARSAAAGRRKQPQNAPGGRTTRSGRRSGHDRQADAAP
jgi:hypothetical protein